MIQRRIAAALAVGLLGAGMAWAQSVVQDGQSTRQSQLTQLGGHLVRSDSTQDANSGDGSGNLYVREAAPDQTFLVKHQSIIQNVLWRTAQCQAAPTTCTFVLPQADSSSALNTLGATRLALLISYTLDDSACAALLCVEVRGHMTQNVDSTNTFLWRWRNQTIVAEPDTTLAMATTNPGTTVAAFASTALDTTNLSYYERPVILNSTLPHRGIWLPIVNRNTGEYFQAPYTSIKVRIIKVYGSTACTAWTGKAGPKITLNIDLVGWR